MKRLLPLALLLAGCAPTATESEHQPDSGASTSAQTAPPTPTVNVVPPKPEGNPNRIYQLKSLKKVDVSLKGHPVHLWVMDDGPKQEEGMMFLTDGEVKADEGMLFAFSELQRKADNKSFWMHNTLIPLDIVYLAPDGKVLNVGEGKRLDDSPVPPTGDYRNVIELKAGTAAKMGLKPGDALSIPALPK